MNLRTIQQQFKHALLTGEYAALLAEIYGSDQADKQNRLNIYRDNVRGSCLKVLEQAYPVCGRVLGEHIFLRAARGYVLTHPSRSSDLNTYGAAFTDFLSLLCQQETICILTPFYLILRIWNGRFIVLTTVRAIVRLTIRHCRPSVQKIMPILFLF